MAEAGGGGIPTREEGLAFLNEMVRRRGYTARTHTLLAAHDLRALQAYDPVPTGVYVEQRRLDPRVKELCLVAGFACLKGPSYALKTHMRKAAGIGIEPATMLTAFCCIAGDVGNAVIAMAFESWLEEFGDEKTRRTDGGGRPMRSDPLTTWREMFSLLDRHDPKIGATLEALLHKVHAEPRLLDERTKELLLIVVLVCLRASSERMRFHIARALETGWDAAEVLEALELVIPHAGLLAFEAGLNAWASETDAAPLEPEGALYSKLD